MLDYPKVSYKEEGMREGMQIEDAQISVDDKITLLDALSDTGLNQIVVGSFVSRRWTPQMERIDEIVTRFTPKPGVTYSALALNARGVERARAYSPPLTIERDRYPRLSCHLCDVFARRNTNRSQMQEMERWPQVIAQAQELNITESGIGCNASWGSNFLGEFPVDTLMTLLEKQHGMWDEVGIKVRSVSMGDPMSHCAHRQRSRKSSTASRNAGPTSPTSGCTSTTAATWTSRPHTRRSGLSVPRTPWSSTAPSAATAGAPIAAMAAPPAWPPPRTFST